MGKREYKRDKQTRLHVSLEIMPAVQTQTRQGLVWRVTKIVLINSNERAMDRYTHRGLQFIDVFYHELNQFINLYAC